MTNLTLVVTFTTPERPKGAMQRQEVAYSQILSVVVLGLCLIQPIHDSPEPRTAVGTGKSGTCVLQPLPRLHLRVLHCQT